MIINCNRLWTQLVSVVFRLRRLPMVTTTPPPPPPPPYRPKA